MGAGPNELVGAFIEVTRVRAATARRLDERNGVDDVKMAKDAISEMLNKVQQTMTYDSPSRRC